MWTRTYLIPYFGKCKLDEISVDMVNSFWQVLKEKHNLAPKTINNIRSVFIIMMKEAVNRELIESNHVEKTFARTVDKKKQMLLTRKALRYREDQGAVEGQDCLLRI